MASRRQNDEKRPGMMPPSGPATPRGFGTHTAERRTGPRSTSRLTEHSGRLLFLREPAPEPGRRPLERLSKKYWHFKYLDRKHEK